jgi:hypothetical protein
MSRQKVVAIDKKIPLSILTWNPLCSVVDVLRLSIWNLKCFLFFKYDTAMHLIFWFAELILSSSRNPLAKRRILFRGNPSLGFNCSFAYALTFESIIDRCLTAEWFAAQFGGLLPSPPPPAKFVPIETPFF